MVKLKVRNLNWIAGKPIVFLNPKTAEKLNVHVGERILIKPLKNNGKIYGVVDIFPKIVKNNEIGLSNEIISSLRLKNKDYVDIRVGEMFLASALIKKKLSGECLTKKEINVIVSEIVDNNLSEAEIAYFAAAQKAQGMSDKETIYLTESMVKNGKRLKFKEKLIADKHCIGGIAGNRTTPLVVSICCAAGLKMPKTSSRAITSASGTADVIETIANIEFNPEELKRLVETVGGCLAWGGALNLAPSDDKIIYVERILNLDIEPQLLSSIMSKKIAAGSNRVLIDVPYGRGGKIENLKEAKKLGEKFKKIAKHFKLKLKVVYTNGKEPIGNGIGPVLEMLDVLKVLKNEEDCPKDLKEKGIYLASELMKLCGIKNSLRKAKEILESGKAYEKFKEIINAQNGKDNFDFKISKLKIAKYKKEIYAKKSGRISYISNKDINSLCRILGTPEDKSSGVFLHKHIGKVRKGEKILTIYSESKDKLKDGLKFIKNFSVFELV